ncbi:MAG: potassium/proton antiporter [Oscillospiraceae bacterium]|nr:potassium/proton antiporter [Oscillospiraceae bacterium]
MYIILIIASIIILLCVLLSKALHRFGVPSLLIFVVLGMLAGMVIRTIMRGGGFGGIFTDDASVTEAIPVDTIASFALVFIMFYGGFATKWETAKPVALRAGIMSSLGTIITAFGIASFCFVIFNVPFLYGLLFGSVVSSTDAASVFSILRSRKLNLKGGLAPLLEIESGSNDPFSYMLTIISITALQAQGSGMSLTQLIKLILIQITAALIIAALASVLAVLLLKRLNLENTGFYPILIFAIIMMSFSICTLVNGNGLLCVYITGIVVGNNKFSHKKHTVQFFDSISWLMQIVLFFMLGLISHPSMLPAIAVEGTILSVLLIIVVRPVATALILSWFKTPIKQQIFVSWVGLRGAASIAFAIIATEALEGSLPYDLFHLVFYVALFSVMVQGTLIPFAAKKLDLIDDSDENAVMKTFTDYFDGVSTQLYEYKVEEGDTFAGKSITDANIPQDMLIIMIKRKNKVIVPKGTTQIIKNDVLVVSGQDFSFFTDEKAAFGSA